MRPGKKLRALALLVVLAVVAGAGLQPAPARAASVYTVSAEQLEGTVSAITPDGQLELVRDGSKSSIPLEKVHRIQIQNCAPARDPASRVEVRTIHGALIYGTLVTPEPGGALALASPALGQTLQLDAPSLLGVRFTRRDGQNLPPDKFAQELAAPDKKSDTLFVTSKKEIVPFSAVVTKIGPKTTLFNWDRQDRSIDTTRLAAIAFANAPAAGPAQSVVHLTDASLVCGKILSLTPATLLLDFYGAKVPIPMTAVISIEPANPNIVYLSDQKPVEVREIPFFNHIWKHRLDQSVGGNPITLDAATYARGIGCHTRTTLTYDLNARYSRFAAQIGIDDEARPRGSVQFIVQADQKQIYSTRLTGADKSVNVTLDITNVKKLSLVTDFAEDASVGDHADWADARVMK